MASQTKLQTNFSLSDFFSHYLIPIIVAIIIILSIFLIGLPSVRQASTLRQDIAQKKQELAVLTTKLSQLNAITESQLSSQLLDAQLALPSKKPVFETLSSINQQASASGVVLGDFNFSPGSVATQSADTATDEVSDIEPGKLAKMPLEVSLTGTIDTIVSFLKILSQSAPLFEVSQISLNTGEETEDLEGSNASITFDVLYALPPQDIGKSSTPLLPITDQQMQALQQVQALNKYSQEFNFDNTNTGKTNPFGY